MATACQRTWPTPAQAFSRSSLDRDLSLLRRWTAAVDPNSLHVLWVDEAWDGLLGFGGVDGSEPSVIKARRWLARWVRDGRWRCLAGAVVPGPR